MEEEKVEKCSNQYVPSGAVTFAELESMQKAAETGRAVFDLTWQFGRLIDNIIYDTEINNKSQAIKRVTDEYTSRLDKIEMVSEYKESTIIFKDGEYVDTISSVQPNPDTHEKSPIKRENNIDYPARDYAWVPDPKRPATWKLRLTETPGKISLNQLGRAAASLSAGGFRGQKAQIPGTALSAVKRRIRAEYRKLGVPEEKIPMSVKKSLTIWKDNSGQWRWLGIYSNNFRDRDNPPEIISEKSHKTFVGMVENQIIPPPELQHWHIANSKWGTGEMVGYDHGFAWASGVVDAGHEKEAEAVSQMDDLRMSHGMPSRFIKRRDDDPTIIDFHVTTEVSVLPGEAAANELTEFFVFEGVQKMSDTQKEYLKAVGLSEDAITALASGFESKEQAAVDAGFERKDVEEDDKAKKPPMVEEEDEEEDDKKKPAKKEAVTSEEIASALGSVIKPILAQLKTMNERLGSMESKQKEMEVFTSDQKEMTPSLSLQELIGQSLFGEPIDGRSNLAKSKPKMKEHIEQATPVPYLNKIIQND